MRRNLVTLLPLASLPVLGLCALSLSACSDDEDGDVATAKDAPTIEPTPSIDPTTIPKFVEPLVVPGVMPSTGSSSGVTEYRIAVRQFQQQVLPPPLPKTTVYGYGRDGDPLPGEGPSTYSYPGLTVETRSNQPVRVTWVNRLVDDDGNYLPHFLPIDSTLHWANPGNEPTPRMGHTAHTGGQARSDAGLPPARYTGPVPVVTHVHGAHSFDHSDGHPEAWFLPDAENIPAGFDTTGPRFRTQAPVPPGEAVFDYPLDEAAATLWYHDHTLGMTRINIFAGLEGFWLIRDEFEDSLDLPGPAPTLGEPAGTKHYEIPLLIQDRTFAPDGSLSFPTSRAQYDGYDGPFIPDSEVPPIWGPEFFGNVMVVNGRTWPYLEVEPRLYRFRILNGSDARTLRLYFDDDAQEFIQIGGDGGFTPKAPVRAKELLVGAAERYDVLVDFSGYEAGDVVTLLNSAPDEAWGGPDADPPQAPADPETTGQVMQFRVVDGTSAGNPGKVPEALPPLEELTPTVPPRDLLLQELAVDDQFPYHVLLGTVKLGPLMWAAPATEIIQLDSTEVWRVANTTEDAHPIHIHLIDFQVLDRTPFDVDAFKSAENAWLGGTGPEPKLEDFFTGPPSPPEPNETSEKDTVLMLPGTITRIVARYDRAGSYVWHCHIIEHEDNDMMRPLEIVSDAAGPIGG